MIAEFGFFALILALAFSFILAIVPTIGLLKDKPYLLNTLNIYVFAQFLFILIAYLLLTYCFLTDDFSLRYVLANSSTQLPWFYKFCAVWGGHEGSILLWVFILSIWTLAVSMTSRSLPLEIRARVLIVLGLLCFGFLLFIVSTSNPFLRQFIELDTQGRDLNPLLQDPGFLFHPPMLYIGYVGFSVVFAFAIAALWLGRMEAFWIRWTRPWTLAAWCALTLGITLGSWWAYRELGWGGWWFWDPVENASFMPWLVGTALIHSLAVSEQRGQFKAWTLLLAISAFSLSLLGTFLVRSGVLTSVHAFAVDPARGLYILCFLLFVIGGSLLLFAIRSNPLRHHTAAHWLSRDSALLLNNVFLTAAMLTVLLGTIYPLLIDALGLGKLSVGAPYFNAVFVPLMLPLLMIMGLAPHLKWQQDQLKSLLTRLPVMLLLLALCAVIGLRFYVQELSLSVLLGILAALYLILSTLKALLLKAKAQGFASIRQAYWGMVLAHLGIAITVLGIAVSSGFGLQADVRLSPGKSTTISSYVLSFEGEETVQGPNYHGTRARIRLEKGSQTHFIYPEKRLYDIAQMPMTDSAIDVNPIRDIYVALGEPLGEGAWSVRIYYKPLVRWIWAGGFIIFLAGVLALTDRRYYQKQAKRLEAPL